MVKKVKKYQTRKQKKNKKKGKKYKKTMKIKKGGAKSTSPYNKLVGCIMYNGPKKMILLSSRYINNRLHAMYLPTDIFEENNKDKIPLKNNQTPGRSWYDSKNTDAVFVSGEPGLISANIRQRSIEMFGGNYDSSISHYKSLHAYYSQKVQEIYDSYTNNIDLTKLKQLHSVASKSTRTLPLNSNYQDETQKNNVVSYFKEKKCIEKCKEYLSIMKQKINLTMTQDKIEEKKNIENAYKYEQQRIQSVEGYTKSFGEIYRDTPWGSMGGRYVPTYDACQSFSIISTVVDFAIRNNNKNICVPHGIDLRIHRKFSGLYGRQVDSLNKLINTTNIPQTRALCFPIQPSLSIRNDYKDFAWEEAFKEAESNGSKYVDKGGKKMTKNELKKYKKMIQNVENDTGENLYPVENLGSWYTTDFRKKIVSYKKNVDPNFNIPSKIRYAIERCLFNKEDLSRYNPDNICGIYLPLGVTTGIKRMDNGESSINHANMVYIQKVSKDAQGKYKLKMYLFDPNYDPTFYLKNRLDNVIASINSSQNDYVIETEAVDVDMKVPMIFNDPFHTNSKDDDVGIHSLFPNGWIGGGICGSVTWFIFIIWSLVCKEIPTFEEMYLDILMPLYIYKQQKTYEKQYPKLKLSIMDQQEGNELEKLYIDFLFVIWEFLKWSRDQLSDEKLFMLHLYKKKLCYLDTIIYKQEKYKV